MQAEKMKLVLDDGSCFEGISGGASRPVVGELIFNTSMVGYQELISDPSYIGQIMVMTYPLMGQYGVVDEDYESKISGPAGLVVRELCPTPSNFRCTNTLNEYLLERDIPCLEGVDTRMLTQIIRSRSNVVGALVPSSVSTGEALDMIGNFVRDDNPVASASCSHRWFSRTPNHRLDAVVLDLGMKRSVVTELNRRGVNVTVVPYSTGAEEIMNFKPDGLLLSSGPGDPSALPDVIRTVQALKGRLPVCGIGLGHQIIGLSYGVPLVDLGCGHHGGAPVRELPSARIFTAELNHCKALDRNSVRSCGLELTYENVLDGCVEGIRNEADRIFSCEFTPEGFPGPQENDFFDDFASMMDND